jgi:uncharacterized protein
MPGETEVRRGRSVTRGQREALLGIISDTHGLLRAEAIGALRGSDIIIHAGDVGEPEIIDRLRDLAPTYVVRGNG